MEPAKPVELRKNTRAHLALPVRIRWRGPLAMKLEVARTLDVSREGLLVYRKEQCEPNVRVWVVCPYERAASPYMPVPTETPGRVARVDQCAGGGYQIAIQFAVSRPDRVAAVERRIAVRLRSAVTIFVRHAESAWPGESAWPEESMTQDLSLGGVRFESAYIYSPGDTILAKIPCGEWLRSGEVCGRVVRVTAMPDLPGMAPAADLRLGRTGMYTSVAVEWTSAKSEPKGR